MKSLKNQQRGVAHLALILLVVVVAVIGYAGWKVMQNRNGGVANSVANTVATKEAQDACNKLYNDKDLCKFTTSWNAKASYKATFSNTDKDGKTSTMLMEQDGKDNSSFVSKDGNTETSAFVSLNGDTYIKDETDGSWVKYPKSPTAPATSSPTSDLKIDDSTKEAALPEAQRTVYKKLGKEKCGNATCFKYQVIDPSLTDVKESILWFGDKDYQLHKWSVTNTDGSKNVGEFTYTSVNITAPSPVKDAPAVPTIPDITTDTSQ